MPLHLLTIPCQTDNYAFVVHNDATGETALIDAPEAAPIRAALDDLGWRLTQILLTHHHGDHVEGVAALRPGAQVIGAAADAHRLPPLDLTVAPGDVLQVCGESCEVIDVPGHTVGHVAYHFPASRLAFTGDSLMALGCGRLFEGSPAQMWASLSRLAALPDDTRICFRPRIRRRQRPLCRHDRAGQPRPGRADRPYHPVARRGPPDPAGHAGAGEGHQPIPARRPARVRAAVGLPDAPDHAVFAEIRARKDRF